MRKMWSASSLKMRTKILVRETLAVHLWLSSVGHQ